MPKSFNFVPVRRNWRGVSFAAMKDPRVGVRALLGTLLALNVVAAVILFKPWGGSAEDLEGQLVSMRQELAQHRVALERTKTLAAKVEKARAEGDEFMTKYMLNARTAYSTLIGELDRAAAQVSLKPREGNFSVEPIDGSDTLEIMTITANYEGVYANLTKFINELDRSPQFLIIESLQAAPQPVGPVINVNFKLKAFVRDETGASQ